LAGDNVAMGTLLSREALPKGFAYPREFLRVIELGLTNLEPWHLLDGDLLVQRYGGMANRYPNRRLVPFARRQDNDDVACWDADQPKQVLIIHDLAESDWAQRKVFDGFYAWLRQAVDDLIEFDSAGWK